MDQPRENDKQRREETEEEVQSRYTGVPIEIKMYIKENLCCTCKPPVIDDGILMIQKPLSKRDVNPQKGRFSCPSSSLIENYVFYDNMPILEVPVTLIEPSLRHDSTIRLREKKKKKKKNSSGIDSILYVFKKPWNEIVTRNSLEAGQIVQLWAIRVNGVLVFALRRLMTEEGNNDSESSYAATEPSSSSSSGSWQCSLFFNSPEI